MNDWCKKIECDFFEALFFNDMTKCTVMSSEYVWLIYSDETGVHFDCTHLETDKQMDSTYPSLPTIQRYNIKLTSTINMKIDIQLDQIEIVGVQHESTYLSEEDLPELPPTDETFDELIKVLMDSDDESLDLLDQVAIPSVEESLLMPGIDIVLSKELEFQCRICLEIVHFEQEYSYFCCGHDFHTHCAEAWENECPYCSQTTFSDLCTDLN